MVDVCQTPTVTDNAQQIARTQSQSGEKCSQEALQLLNQSKLGSFKTPDLSKVSSIDLGSSSDLQKLYGNGDDQKLKAGTRNGADQGVSTQAERSQAALKEPGQTARNESAQAARTEARSDTHSAATHGRQSSETQGENTSARRSTETHAETTPARQTSDTHGDAHPARQHAAAHHEAVQKAFSESTHKVAPGQTLDGIAHDKLGPNAKKEDIDRYVATLQELNNINEPKSLRAGSTIVTPGREKDGTFTGHSNDKSGTRYENHPDGSQEWHNKDGSGTKRTAPGKDGTTEDTHYGPKPEQNWKTFNDGDHHVDMYADGSTSVRDGDKRTDYNNDGSEVTHAPNGGPVERSMPNKGAHDRGGTDRTITTTWNGETTVKNQGDESGYNRKPDGQGGYTEHGWGKKPEQNYDETYNAKDGTTTRSDATGTKTTQYSDGTKKVEHADKTGYQTHRDGSEHHFGPKGKDNYDKPAEDSLRTKR